MKYVYVENNKAVEVVSGNPFIIFVPHYADKFVETTDDCKVGDEYVGGNWVTPTIAMTIPQEITMRQARLSLLDTGLLVNVQTAINSLPEPDKTKAQIEWEYSNALQRNNPFVITLGTALGLSSTDIDNLFITAAGL